MKSGGMIAVAFGRENSADLSPGRFNATPALRTMTNPYLIPYPDLLEPR
jgi:hypothetical protein